MKAQLMVVVGNPEGKIIPLAIAQFKIGRGEGCQLRPNSDQISREHAMFEVTSDSVFLQDLGSRNGTELNGKKLNAHDPSRLKNGDLVKVGSLTFAVSIEGVAVAAQAPAGAPKKAASLDDVGGDEIDAWLVSDTTQAPPERPSGVYGGETLTIKAFKAKDMEKPAPRPTLPAPAPAAKPQAPAPVAKVPEPEPEAVEDEIAPYEEEDEGIEDLSEKVEAELPEEFVDESNPFYVKKNKAAPAAASSKEPQKDSSDAAHDILRRMMDRKKASKS